MPNSPLLNRRSTWGWLAIAAALAALVYLLQPVLMPFVLSALIAYACQPLVLRLDRHLPRPASVLLVLLLVLAALALLLGIVLPLLVRELTALAGRVPALLERLDQTLAPWINAHLGTDVSFDMAALKEMLAQTLKNSEGLGLTVLQSLRLGGLGLIGLIANLVLVPIVIFFLMRDWEKLLASLQELIPPAWRARTLGFAREADQALGQYLHGQVLVLLVMSVYYTVALWLTGLDGFLPIGITTGLLTFIPYVGAAIGFVLATLAAMMQFDDFTRVLWVWGVFFAGQALEGHFVTPKLVGRAIGLHPVAVIFALLAFGELFGFTGLLLALPASAVLLIAMRHLRAYYFASELYNTP
jgi:predicted PurR-regulated permease PerM